MRFYTLPPYKIRWPYTLRNINQPFRCFTIEEIVDIGIYDLVNGSQEYSKEKLKKWEYLIPRGYKVVPDCPDLEGEFGKKMDFCNIEYSLELLEKYYNPDDSTHIPVLQSKFQKMESVESYIKEFKKRYEDPEFLAVGSVCKAIPTFSIEACKLIRKEFPDSRIHAFGLRLRALNGVKDVIDSFDTTSWSFSPTEYRSARNADEKREFFWSYIERINEVLGVRDDETDFPKQQCCV